MRQSLVTIYDIELLECRLPELTIRVRCSKGTYIRSLAREIGEALSSGAYLTSLRRTRSGTHDVEAAWQLDDFRRIYLDCFVFSAIEKQIRPVRAQDRFRTVPGVENEGSNSTFRQ